MNALEILEQLCLQPTVSYHESRVARVITRLLAEAGVSSQFDRWGNVMATVPGDDALPPIVFVAHMDHPGFEAIGAEGNLIIAEPRGGLGARAFELGTAVIVEFRDRSRAYGRIVSHGLIQRSGRFARTDRISIQLDDDGDSDQEQEDELRYEHDLNFPAAVVFDLSSFDLIGEMIHARQLDDLAGCATILAALMDVNEDRSNHRTIIGLFTRAEEVGLVGACLVAGDEVIPKDAVIVSVETSLKSDNARQGDGVIIRTGDRMTTFDHDAEAVLHAAARRVSDSDAGESFRVQRALMGAGGCEASAFKAHGYRVTGTSFPLGAWHNTEDDGSIVPEYIHLNDFRSGVALITEAMLDDGSTRRDDPLRYLAAFPESGAMRLRQTPI